MNEDLFHGPSGIIPRQDWMYTIDVPPLKRLRFNFIFNALWENMMWICSRSTGEIIIVKGNYPRNSEDWVSDNNNSPNQVFSFGIVAYHKQISATADDAGSYPWRQSPMKILDTDPRNIRVGFNDEGGSNYDNALVTIYTLD